MFQDPEVLQNSKQFLRNLGQYKTGNKAAICRYTYIEIKFFRLLTQENMEYTIGSFKNKQQDKCLLLIVVHMYHCNIHIDYCFIYGNCACIIIKLLL